PTTVSAASSPNDYSTLVGDPAKSAVKDIVPPSCTPSEYAGQADALARCQQCKAAISGWKRKITDKSDASGVKDTTLSSGFGRSTGNLSGLDGQSADFNTYGGVANGAGQTFKDRGGLG